MVFNILDTIPLHTDVRVESIDLEPQFARWLEAVGLEPGTTVRVLRRAIWGGPIHLRSSTGGELAIHRSLARCIKVAPMTASAERAAAVDETQDERALRGPTIRRADVDCDAELGSIRQSTA